jgi:methyl-accepting chemotaxis protein
MSCDTELEAKKGGGRVAWWKNRIILRVSVSLIIAVSIVFAGFTVLMNMSLNKAVEQTMSKKGEQIAAGFAADLDIPQLELYLKQPEENETYWEIRNQLNAFREQIGAMYVYIVQYINDKPFIIIDGQPEGSEVASPIMEETDIDDAHYQMLLKGETAATGIVHDELYGVYISSFAPVMNGGGQFVAALGIDFDVRELEMLASQIMQDNMSVYLIFALVILFMITLTAIILVGLCGR